jgi:integrase
MRSAIPHTWRRTVATKPEKTGWAPSDIADQLGHVDASMTQQKYLDRDLMARSDDRAADVL